MEHEGQTFQISFFRTRCGAGGTTYTPPAESSSFPTWKAVIIAVSCLVGLVGLVVALTITTRYCTAKDSNSQRNKDARDNEREKDKTEKSLESEEDEDDERNESNVEASALMQDRISKDGRQTQMPSQSLNERDVQDNSYSTQCVNQDTSPSVFYGELEKSTWSTFYMCKSEPWTKAYNEFVCGNLLVTETMGIEARDGLGFNIGDITYFLKGNIKKEYKFDQANPITPQSPDFKQNPSTADRVHCVIICLKATELAHIQPGHREKIQALLDATKALKIPQIMILTNIDNLCAFVKENVRNTFKSSTVHKAVYVANQTFKIPEEYIHSVRNFTSEIDPEPMQSILLLTALKQAFELANDSIYLQELNQREKLYETELPFA